MAKTFLYVGCCNRDTPYFATHNGKGIAVFAIDPESGELSEAGLRDGIDNPTFLCVDSTGRHLYASSEVFGWNEGVVSAYGIDPATGALGYINKQPTLGSITAFDSFDRTGRHLLVANYGMGPVDDLPNRAAVSFPIRQDGGLAAPADGVVHEGSGPNAQRQERSHAHAIRVSPDNRFALVTDLGLDTVFSYAFDATSGRFGARRAFRLPDGCGPRHFLFNAAGSRVYVANELASTVSSLSYDAPTGGLEGLDSCSTIPTDAGQSHCSEIVLAPSGRRLYVANRGHDSIATIEIDAQSGRLALRANTPSGGRTPRHMAVDPTGVFLVVANQDSDRLTVFRIGEDEALTLVAEAVTGTPTCIAFRPG